METNNQEFDSLFISIKNILLQDKNLCNFSRYFDYGKIKKTTTGSEYQWETIPCVINDNNKCDNSQVVRFVNKLDTKFFETLKCLNNTINSNDYDYGNRSTSQINVLYNSYRKFTHDTYGMTVSDICHELSNIMINIDCKFKVKGTSLTPFDFLGKNPLATNTERDFYHNYICANISKLIFVGDKCFLICIIDRYHNIYVSTKVLQKIYELDTTDNKSDFSAIIIKLFNVISKCCIYFLNTSIAQYFTDIVCCPITNEIFKSTDFNIEDKITLQSLDNFSFSEDVDQNNYVKNSINEIIKDYVEKYLNKNYYWSSINFKTLIEGMMNKAKQTAKIYSEKAYKNGLRLSNIFSSMGWTYCDINSDLNRDLTRNVSGLFRESHIYMYKTVNFIPSVAFLYSDQVRNSVNIHNKKDKEIPYRILNEEGKEFIASNYGFIVRTLFLDITDGIMLCDGRHPNVSTGSVCMGDLRGMVSFENASEEKCRDLITKCENLLTCINYTSAYRHEGENVFLNDEYSKPYCGFDTSKIDSNSENEDKEEAVKEFDSVTNVNDMYDVDDETQQTQQENNDENTDFDDVGNESEEFEEES